MSWQGVAVHALFLCVCFNYYCRSPHTLSTGREIEAPAPAPCGVALCPRNPAKKLYKAYVRATKRAPRTRARSASGLAAPRRVAGEGAELASPVP